MKTTEHRHTNIYHFTDSVHANEWYVSLKSFFLFYVFVVFKIRNAKREALLWQITSFSQVTQTSDKVCSNSITTSVPASEYFKMHQIFTPS